MSQEQVWVLSLQSISAVPGALSKVGALPGPRLHHRALPGEGRVKCGSQGFLKELFLENCGSSLLWSILSLPLEPR